MLFPWEKEIPMGFAAGIQKLFWKGDRESKASSHSCCRMLWASSRPLQKSVWWGSQSQDNRASAFTCVCFLGIFPCPLSPSFPTKLFSQAVGYDCSHGWESQLPKSWCGARELQIALWRWGVLLSPLDEFPLKFPWAGEKAKSHSQCDFEAECHDFSMQKKKKSLVTFSRRHQCPIPGHLFITEHWIPPDSTGL